MRYFSRYVFELLIMSNKVKLSDLAGNVKSFPFSSSITGSSKTTKQQEEGDKMKTKLLEAWNNWKFGKDATTCHFTIEVDAVVDTFNCAARKIENLFVLLSMSLANLFSYGTTKVCSVPSNLFYRI